MLDNSADLFSAFVFGREFLPEDAQYSEGEMEVVVRGLRPSCLVFRDPEPTDFRNSAD